MQRRHELVRVPEDLVRDEGDEVETGDQATHLVFLVNLDAKLLLEQVVHEMGAAAGGHELDTFSHVFYRDAVDGRRALDEFSQESDAIVNVIGFKLDKVEPSSGQCCW